MSLPEIRAGGDGSGARTSKGVWSGLPGSEDQRGCADTAGRWHQETKRAKLTPSPFVLLGTSLPFSGSVSSFRGWLRAPFPKLTSSAPWGH